VDAGTPQPDGSLPDPTSESEMQGRTFPTPNRLPQRHFLHITNEED